MDVAAINELETATKAVSLSVDHVWVMTCAALVMFMQLGFLLLEAGMSRAKNSLNVAQKNICDFLISFAAFYVVGFGLMFGTSHNGLIGTDHFVFKDADSALNLFFFFQAVFVGTAATIVSGAVAERMAFDAYLFISAVIALVIYPVFGHWAWGNLYITDNSAFLADKGFIDFAGSTVVHSVGAWVALAGIMVVGPRTGKFSAKGTPLPMHGRSYALATGGAVILWIGWIGFNGGSVGRADPDFSRIVVNTILAGAFGGITAMFAGRFLDGYPMPTRPINGSLAGLVGITAGCASVDAHGAIIIGTLCGFAVIFSERFVEKTLKLDDVVGAVSVHGVCGALGTVLTAVFALPEALAAEDRIAQLVVQLEGVMLCFIWAFPVAYIAFRIVAAMTEIRIPEREERIGVDKMWTAAAGAFQQQRTLK